MKNYEKYADEIREYKGKENFCDDFVIPHILNSSNCNEIVTCGVCRMLQMIWLMEEYEEPKEPEVDWSKVATDTPILVRYTKDEDEEWVKRHFAKYENGKVYTYSYGSTSWSADGTVTAWNYAKLAESEEGGAK